MRTCQRAYKLTQTHNCYLFAWQQRIAQQMLLKEVFKGKASVVNVLVSLELAAARQSINQNCFKFFVAKVGFQLRKYCSLFLYVVKTKY